MAFLVVPVVLIGALALAIRRGDALLLFTAGACVGSAIIIFLAHVFFGVPYPIDRTGIYFLVLVPLSISGLVDSGVPPPLPRIAAVLLYGLGLALVLQFAFEFNVRSFLTWEYDVDTRAIVDRLAQAAGPQPPDSVRVGASWQLEPESQLLSGQAKAGVDASCRARTVGAGGGLLRNHGHGSAGHKLPWPEDTLSRAVVRLRSGCPGPSTLMMFRRGNWKTAGLRHGQRHRRQARWRTAAVIGRGARKAGLFSSETMGRPPKHFLIER